jgi:ribosomal protein L7Ae-like RNA K-turn-binding protein
VTDRRLGLLGLGRRAGTVVVGVAGVRARLQAGRLACVVVAADAGPRTRDKVTRLATARGVPVLVGPLAGRLGAALGSAPVQAVGVADPALARGLVEAFGGVRGNDADS